jgi:ABC-type branched-subunit amino acid transport system permease subunit
MTRTKWAMLTAVLVAMAAAVMGPSLAVFLRTLAVFALYVVFLSGLRIVTGLTGLVSLAHFAIIGVGAYSAAIVALRLDSFGITAVVAGIGVGTVAAIGIALASMKLTEDYYAFATVAAGEMLGNVFRGAGDLTGGPNGLTAIPPVQILGYALNVPHRYVSLCLAGGLLAYAVMTWYERSTIGVAIRAAADEGPRVQCLGVRHTTLRFMSFATGGALAGFGGALIAATDHFVGPESFGIHQSITLLCFLVIGGGLTNRWGVLLAAFFASFGLEALRPLGEWQMIAVSATALILLMTQSRAGR